MISAGSHRDDWLESEQWCNDLWPAESPLVHFDFDPARKKLRARYLALHDLDFLDKGVNPLFIGTPGTGKTFLAHALAYKACLATRRVVFVSAPRMLSELHGAEIHGALERALRRFVRAELLVIDDFAVLAMDAAQAKLAFQVISERYDYRRATCITTNRRIHHRRQSLLASDSGVGRWSRTAPTLERPSCV